MTERIIQSPRRNLIKNSSYSPSCITKNSPSKSPIRSNITTPLRSTITTPVRNIYSSLIRNATPTLKRKYTQDTDEEDTVDFKPISRSNSSNSTSTQDQTRWTKEHWKKLEDWYIRKNRDFRKAANSFYYFESLINIELPNQDDSKGGKPLTKELWTLDQIIWRSQCLDTSVKFHDGLLPSERAKKQNKKRKLNVGLTASSSISTLESTFKRPTRPRSTGSRTTVSARSSVGSTTPTSSRSLSASSLA